MAKAAKASLETHGVTLPVAAEGAKHWDAPGAFAESHTRQELGERRAGVGKPLGKCHKYLSVFPEIAEPVHALPATITSLCEKLFVLVFALGKCPTQIH